MVKGKANRVRSLKERGQEGMAAGHGQHAGPGQAPGVRALVFSPPSRPPNGNDGMDMNCPVLVGDPLLEGRGTEKVEGNKFPGHSVTEGFLPRPQ